MAARVYDPHFMLSGRQREGEWDRGERKKEEETGSLGYGPVTFILPDMPHILTRSEPPQIVS